MKIELTEEELTALNCSEEVIKTIDGIKLSIFVQEEDESMKLDEID